METEKGSTGLSTDEALSILLDEDINAVDDKEDGEYEPEEIDVDEGLDEEQIEMNRAGEEMDMRTPFFSSATFNIEKFGESTSARAKQDKIDYVSHGVDAMQPHLTTLQEVTSANLFLNGKKSGGGLMNQVTEPFEHMDEDRPKPRLLSDDFTALEGTAFKSGTYKENYPFLLNNAVFHNAPELSYYDRESEKYQSYDSEMEPLPFGQAADLLKANGGKQPKKPRGAKKKGEKEGEKKKKTKSQISRPVTKLSVDMPTDPYNLRPAAKSIYGEEGDAEYQESHANLSHRISNTQKLDFFPIHTSPSISTITKQMQEHIDLADQSRQEGNAVVMGGDAYMEKSAKRLWSKLSKGDDDWNLAHASINTNFPSKEGSKKRKTGNQNADVFVSSGELTPTDTFAITPPPKAPKRRKLLPKKDDDPEGLRSLEGNHSLPNDISKAQYQERASRVLDSQIDHVGVYSQFDLIDESRKEKAKNASGSRKS